MAPEPGTEAKRNTQQLRPRPGAAVVADALRECGVKRVLGISGTPVEQVFSECWARQIRPIGTRHQQAAVIMAATANYVAGHLESVAVVSAGPAVTNALTGVLVARDNGWPVIVLGGRRPLLNEGAGYFQELDAVPIYQNVTKWAAKVQSGSEIAGAIARAVEAAWSGRPGPVYLDLPEDVLGQMVGEAPYASPAAVSTAEPDDRVTAECAQLLFEADRPLLILGEGVRWSFEPNVVRTLVEEGDIPFITTPMARGFLADGHRLCANPARRWIQSQADLVLIAGASFDWRFRFGGEVNRDAKLIHVDIDPSGLGKNVPYARTVHGDSGRFLTRLQQLTPPRRRRDWIEHVNRAREEKRQRDAIWLAKEARPMYLQQFFTRLRACTPDNAILVVDGNHTLSAAQAVLAASSPCSWLDPGWNGCIGAGIPMGIGAALAAPGRPVIVVCGDFGFGISAMELDTAIRHQIPIVVFIVNNNGINGGTRQNALFPPEYAELFSRFQSNVRYERIAEIFGGHGELVDEPAGVGPALERALASGSAACINVIVNPDTPHPGFW